MPISSSSSTIDSNNNNNTGNHLMTGSSYSTYHVRPSEVRAKERMLKESAQQQQHQNGLTETSRSSFVCSSNNLSYITPNTTTNQPVLNKVLALAKTYEPSQSSNPKTATTNKGSIIKIIDNKIADFAPRHLVGFSMASSSSSSSSSPSSSSSSAAASSSSASSSSSSSPASSYANKNFKNETQIRLQSASSNNVMNLMPLTTATSFDSTGMMTMLSPPRMITNNVNVPVVTMNSRSQSAIGAGGREPRPPPQIEINQNVRL